MKIVESLIFAIVAFLFSSCLVGGLIHFGIVHKGQEAAVALAGINTFFTAILLTVMPRRTLLA